MLNLSLPTQIIRIILFWENVIQVCFCLIGLKHTGNRPSFPPFLALYPRLLSLSVCSLNTYFHILSFCTPFQQFSFSLSVFDLKPKHTILLSISLFVSLHPICLRHQQQNYFLLLFSVSVYFYFSYQFQTRNIFVEQKNWTFDDLVTDTEYFSFTVKNKLT